MLASDMCIIALVDALSRHSLLSAPNALCSSYLFSGLIILNLRSSFDKQFIHFFHLQANEIGGGNFFRIENFSETFKIVSKCSDLS